MSVEANLIRRQIWEAKAERTTKNLRKRHQPSHRQAPNKRIIQDLRKNSSTANTNWNTPATSQVIGLVVQHIAFVDGKMIKDSEFDTVTIKGKVAKRKVTSFPCLRCGVCCSKYQALLTRGDEQQIADGLTISRDEFLDRYTDHRWGGTESFILRHQDGACVFLSHVENSRMTYCSINPLKPSDCKAWAPNPCKPECQEGLRNQGTPRLH